MFLFNIYVNKDYKNYAANNTIRNIPADKILSHSLTTKITKRHNENTSLFPLPLLISLY